MTGKRLLILDYFLDVIVPRALLGATLFLLANVILFANIVIG